MTTRRLGFAHERHAAFAGRDEWYTPAWIFNALTFSFDMDVCSPGAAVVPWIPAHTHLTPLEDGLRTPWRGFVWMNPPYGDNAAQWAAKFHAHGHGVALTFARTDTAWQQAHVLPADALLFIAGRVQYIPGANQKLSSPGAGSVLFAYGDRGADAVRRAAARIPGFLFSNGRATP